MLRASTKTKNVPIFGLSVKTAAEEQARAQQAGFSAVITKPIDFEDLKSKVARALHLDTSYKYFEHRDGIVVLKLPALFTPSVANEVTLHLRNKVAEAVDSGLDRLVLDLSQLKTADVSVIKLGLTAMQMCMDLSLKHRVIGSDIVSKECKNYEESKDWRFVSSFEEAVAAFKQG
jgi:two-component system cell cycle response regulator